jgi:hypothetical protein
MTTPEECKTCLHRTDWGGEDLCDMEEHGAIGGDGDYFLDPGNHVVDTPHPRCSERHPTSHHPKSFQYREHCEDRETE